MEESSRDENADIVVSELSGGSGRNIVAGKAEAVLLCKKADPKSVAAVLNRYEGIDATTDNHHVNVRSTGKSTHAMAPENGRNAISHLIAALGTLKYSLDIGAFVKRFNDHIGLDYNGGKSGFGFEDALSGKLTFNIGTIILEENRIMIEANIRYPASLEKDAAL